MIKNYIFDFDGTLADSSIGIHRAFASSCIENDLEPPATFWGVFWPFSGCFWLNFGSFFGQNPSFPNFN